MFKENRQIYSLSIVLVGSFNPTIIQPFWLAHKKLIRDQEAQNAKIEVMHRELVQIDLDWVFLEVTQERFEFRTSKEPYFELVRDLVIGIFGILSDTPIYGLGINHVIHFVLKDNDKYHEFGNRLAPLSNWNSFLNNPKLLNLEVIEQTRKDGLNGQYRIRISPSEQKLSNKFGISLNLNDHFSEPNPKGRSNEMMKILSENWENSFKRAQEIFEQLWTNLNLP